MDADVYDNSDRTAFGNIRYDIGERKNHEELNAKFLAIQQKRASHAEQEMRS